MSELKKCPGCNGEAKFNEQFNGCIPNISKTVFYSCECGWCGPAVTGKCETKEDLFKLAERAAEKWNRRSQPENEPLTLDELRGMDGEPVYIVVLDKTDFADKDDAINGWGLCRKSWVRLWDNARADIVRIDHDFEDYGKTWLAYRAKPERSEG